MMPDTLLIPEVLLAAIRELSFARSRERVTEVVRRAARDLTGADGVTFVLRDGDQCHYVDEEAIGPLWKGQRFPMEECISGWVMVSRQPAVIPDVFEDSRIPHDVYRGTWVRSLAMVPVRPEDPLAAIGAYWAQRHEPTPAEVGALQALADAASLAFANVALYQDLQRSLESERASRAAAESASRMEERSRALAEGEERLRRIIDSLADAIVVVDREGVVKLANPAAEELFGRPRADLVGDCFGLPLVAGETTEVDLNEGRGAEMRVVKLHWEGKPAWLASLRDVTARRQAEDAARNLWRERTAREEAEKERARLEELLVRAPAAILTSRGPRHVCAFANPEMEKLVAGRTLTGNPLAEALPELASQGFLEGFEATQREGTGRSRAELSLSLGSGPGGEEVERCLDVTWEPLRRNGGVDGVLCFAYDVTDQVALRRELESAMERLQEEERAKDHFLAVLGHELRNPLAGIDGGLQLLERGVDEEKGEWALGMMRRQVTVLAGLLDDLFDVSAVARGKLELQRQRVPISEVVDSAVAAARGRYDEHGQTLSEALPERPLIVDGDPRRLEQVLANLLVNASRYSEEGTRVGLEVRREGQGVLVEVTDQGAGIAPEMLDQIFEPFVQARSGLHVTGGLGIGLTLVRQLVELHGGSVRAASPGPGAGSTFTVRLPLAAAAEEASSDQEAAERAQPPARRILVVEDNEDVARSLAELLATCGFHTDIAASGSEGIAKARSEAPDTLLLDLDLPNLSGFEVARQLRAERELEGTLIVAISGFGHQQAQERSRESGIDHHLVKPIDVNRLVDLLALHPPGSEQAART